MGYNAQQQGKMIGGFKPNPPANLNSVGSQWVANPPANLNSVGNQWVANPPANLNSVGNQWVANPPANLNLAPYSPMPYEITRGGNFQEGISGDLASGLGGFQEGISGDLLPDFGMTPQPATSPRIPVQWGGHPSAGVTYPSLPKLDLAEAVKTSKGGRGSKGNRWADIETSKGGRGSRGNRWADIETSKGGRGSKGKHWADDIIDWKGHPSAGVTYPDVVSGPESIDTRIKDKLAFENFGTSEVFPTEDMGKWYDPGIPEGDIRARMALEKGYAQPYLDNINTTLTDSQLYDIQNPGLEAPSVFDEPLDNGGTFAETNFVGPGDYAYGNIQDSSSTLDPRVLAGLNKQGIDYTMDLGRNNFADYVARLPQPKDSHVDDPRGVVAPRHMKDYYEMIGQTGELPAGTSNAELISTIPSVAPADERVDLSRDIVRQPWSHPSAGVTYPNYKKEQLDHQETVLSHLEAAGKGNSQTAIDLKRDIAINKGTFDKGDQSIGLKATLDHIFSRK